MPNHVQTIIHFNGEEAAIRQLLESIHGKEAEQVIDFNRIIPMPAGETDWYRWNVEHWGTKWNAYNCEAADNTIYFTTAWSLGEPILYQLAQMCDALGVTFSGDWCDEDWAGGNCGEFESDSEGALYVAYDETEEEMAQRCEKVWGYNPLDDDEDDE